jgi:hypothetical protein
MSAALFMIATLMPRVTFSVWDVRRLQKEAPPTPPGWMERTSLLADRRLLFDIHYLNAPVFSGQWIGGVLELAPAEADGQQLVGRELELLR